MDNQIVSREKMIKPIIDMAVEAWRFRRVFEKAMSKLDAGESTRYTGQFNWFIKKVNAAIEDAGLHIVDVEGQPFDIGMPVIALNMDDFTLEDTLIIAQMQEPIIMNAGSVVKTGTVILKGVNK